MPKQRILNFIRVQQWYKNTVIFLALFFSLTFFSVENVLLTIFGFIALCLVSSAMYIKNDIRDVEDDKKHPTKRNRPLPAGLITKKQAQASFVVLSALGLVLSFVLDWKFGVLTILLLLNGEFYSIWLKKIIFLDIFSISGNFIIRAISGVILIQSTVSPWLILGIFFVSLFLAIIKRRHEMEFLQDSARKHRKVLNQYTMSTVNSIILITAIMIITTYSIYAMNSSIQDWRLVITVPIVVYIVFRQLHLSSISEEKVLGDNILRDKSTAIAVIVYVAFTFVLLYFVPPIF